MHSVGLLLFPTTFQHGRISLEPAKADEVMKTARKRISVTRENSTGRNTNFRDNYTCQDMTRKDFVRKIEEGNYPDYHVWNINGVPTPVSNPDKKKGNNLD